VFGGGAGHNTRGRVCSRTASRSTLRREFGPPPKNWPRQGTRNAKKILSYAPFRGHFCSIFPLITISRVSLRKAKTQGAKDAKEIVWPVFHQAKCHNGSNLPMPTSKNRSFWQKNRGSGPEQNHFFSRFFNFSCFFNSQSIARHEFAQRAEHQKKSCLKTYRRFSVFLACGNIFT